MKRSLALLGLFLVTWAYASPSFEYLKKYDRKPARWDREITAPSNEPVPAAARVDLGQYYDEFFSKGEINIYYGMGVQAFSSGASTTLYNMIKDLSGKMTLNLTDLVLSSDKKTITFKDGSQNRYRIDIGSERNEYAKSFADYQVVMYHGHSRYGRGPAFETFQNYFRMGHVYETTEVNANNAYFTNEPTMLTDKYPLQYLDQDGKKIEYQYQGTKGEEGSYMGEKDYTRNITAWDKDLVNAKFLEGRQLLWFYSCRNIYYWKDAIRGLFPSVDDKFVFGTKEDGYWSETPAAAFIASIVQRERNSDKIVDAMNATHDCNNCFTSY